MTRRSRDPGAVLAALSDPTRREVIRSLSKDGPQTLSDLASGLPITRQAIAKHLALLQEAGLVEASGETRRRSYRLTPAPLSDAMDWMIEVGSAWDSRLERLRRVVDGAESA
jgi:ArsR family transcriptional regulator, cadmium/lead-responsive transcriptional repressor